jgi:CheY-like chemotaxis protein
VIRTAEEVIDEEEWAVDLGVGSYVVISVADNGVGMDDETREQAIEPFFTTKPIEAGTGLGLTMVHDFVRQCGGGLQIDSAPGAGTTIRMYLPTSREAAETEVGADVEGPSPAGMETVLVVEDRSGVRRFACRTLRRLGYRTLEAENAEDALRQLREHDDIDLLFSDIVMPGETDGRALANQVVRIFPELKILLTTGMEPDKAADVDAELEFPLLAKPYSASELARSVRAAIDE